MVLDGSGRRGANEAQQMKTMTSSAPLAAHRLMTRLHQSEAPHPASEASSLPPPPTPSAPLLRVGAGEGEGEGEGGLQQLYWCSLNTDQYQTRLIKHISQIDSKWRPL